MANLGNGLAADDDGKVVCWSDEVDFDLALDSLDEECLKVQWRPRVQVPLIQKLKQIPGFVGLGICRAGHVDDDSGGVHFPPRQKSRHTPGGHSFPFSRRSILSENVDSIQLIQFGRWEKG